MGQEFPQAAIQAALELSSSWGLENPSAVPDDDAAGGASLPRNPFERKLRLVRKGILKQFSPKEMDYGVGEAVMSGKRLRLLHEVQEKRPRLNCAETGVNMLLLASCHLPTERLRILRYRPDGLAHHLGLVVGEEQSWDSGDNLRLIDPLQHRLGRISLTKDGFHYRHAKDSPKRGLWRRRRAQGFVKTPWELLTVDDAVRHAAHANSPLGFFDYYRDGQQIFSSKKGPASYEFTVRTEGENNDALIFSATFIDTMPLMFTYQRTYRWQDGELRHDDRRLVHAGYFWVHPRDVLYTEDDWGSRLGNFEKRKLATQGREVYPTGAVNVIAYLRHLASRKLTTPDERIAHYDHLWNERERMKKELEAVVKTCERAGDENVEFEFDPYGLMREVTALHDRLEYAATLSPEHLAFMLDADIFDTRFSERKIPVKKPYFSPTPEMHRALHRLGDIQYQKAEARIKEFLESPVVARLREQYVEAWHVRNSIDTILASATND